MPPGTPETSPLESPAPGPRHTLARVLSLVISAAVVATCLTWCTLAFAPFSRPVWAVMLVIATAIANAVVMRASNRDQMLALTAAPAIFLINASPTNLGAVITLWLFGSALGTLVRLRSPAQALEVTANMVLGGVVMASCWTILDAQAAPLIILSTLPTAALFLTRLVISSLRLGVVAGTPLLSAARAITWSRALTMWLLVTAATLGGHGIALVVGTAAPTTSGVQAKLLGSLLVSLIALTLGTYFEYTRVESRLRGLVKAAKALPWPSEVPVAEQAAEFLEEALPHRVITLTSDPEAPIAVPLPGGFLQAHRTHFQPPLRAEDRELVEAFANIAQSTSDAGTERAKLHHAATRDPLTGLLNYRGFTESLTSLEHLDGSGIAIMYLDLDGFKAINDSHGHVVGNLVLQTVAERLQLVLAPDDIASRVGGDEFVVLLVGLHDAQAAQRTAENIATVVSTPVLAEDALVLVNVSFGLAFTESKSPDVAELLQFADARMYESRGNLAPAAPRDAACPGFQVHDIDELLNAITQAITSGGIDLAYQPIIDTRVEQVVAIEALVRVTHPKLGAIPADIVVHEARRLGLVTDLSTAVLSRALADLEEFGAAGRFPLDLHFNVDVEQITDATFRTALGHFLDATDVTVTLELSETSLHRALESTFEELEELNHSNRLQIALDDFGVAQSTLQSVVDYPLSVLKVDRSLVHDMGDEKSRQVLAALSTLCDGLGIRMVVEGVAEEAQLRALVDVGVPFVQGYYFGAPMSASALADRFRNYGTTCPECTRLTQSAGA